MIAKKILLIIALAIATCSQLAAQIPTQEHSAIDMQPSQLELLHRACRHGDLDGVKQLWVTVGHESASKLCAEHDRDGFTALHNAAHGHHGTIHDGHVQIVKFILALPNAEQLYDLRNNQGRSALHLAALYGYTEIAELLLGGSNPSELAAMQDNDGQTALHFAAGYGYVETFKMFSNLPNIQELLCIQNARGLSAIYGALTGDCWPSFWCKCLNGITKEHLEVVKLIMAIAGIDQHRGVIVRELAKWARNTCQWGENLDLLKRIRYALGERIFSMICAEQDDDGDTLLHSAASEGNLQIVTFLLELPDAGMFCAIENKWGRTPYHMAKDHLFWRAIAPLDTKKSTRKILEELTQSYSIRAAFAQAYLKHQIAAHPLIAGALTGTAALGTAAVAHAYFG